MLRIFTLLIGFLFTFNAFGKVIEGTSFDEHNIRDKAGRNVTYYLSMAKTKGAPLLLMIQGSGCNRVFNKSPAGVYSTIFNLVNVANENKFSVLAVEKPFSGAKENTTGVSVELDCSKEFHKDFTVESWVDALNLSIKDTVAKLNYKPSHILIFGHSEGAGIASKLAVVNTSITHVISTGGSGTTQLFDLVAFAYQNCFDRSECIEQQYSQLAEINKDPQNYTKFAWGHPYKRWSSFFRLDAAENLLKSKAKIYLVFGTSDVATPPLSQEIIAAKLSSFGRDITVRRIPGADHMLLNPGAQNMDSLAQEYELAFNWFWNSID